MVEIHNLPHVAFHPESRVQLGANSVYDFSSIAHAQITIFS